jgi:hypothetical protein
MYGNSNLNIRLFQQAQSDKDPWAPKVDLTSIEDKRKAAQLKFESCEESVARERHKMQAQTEVSPFIHHLRERHLIASRASLCIISLN